MLSKPPLPRILKFPHRHSLGTLYLAPATQPEGWELLAQVRALIVSPENEPIKWEWFEEARGSVTIPEGMKVKLKIGGKCSLQALTLLKEDDLHTIDLSRSEVTDIGLSHISALTGLKVLELTATKVSDEALIYLRDLKALQGLGLSHSQITGHGLVHLKELRNLRELWLSNTPINDSDLPGLSHLTELVQLGLSSTNVTDNGLKHLQPLKSLMRVYLFAAPVSEIGVEKLKHLLPGCRIKWKRHEPALNSHLEDDDPDKELNYPASASVASARETNSELFVQADRLIQKSERQRFSEQDFWNLLAQLDWSKLGNDDAVIEPVVSSLSSYCEAEICIFLDVMSEKLHGLDAEKFARHIGRNSYKGKDRNFSRQWFLGARCCVIANGHDYYEEVLADPSQMPQDLEFEALLSIPAKAYERKVGGKFKYKPKLGYETFANKSGWPNTD